MEETEMETIEKREANHLVTIYRVMGKKVFGYRFSAEIVGGRSRLDKLIASGKVQAEKGSSKQNSKIKCNASDVLHYAKACW